MRKLILISLIILTTLAYWIILIFRIPLFQSMKDWFWSYIDKPLGNTWLFGLMALLAYFVISNILNNPERNKRNLILLFLLGYIFHMSFGFLENRGINGIRDRMVFAGCSEFARIASKQHNIFYTITHYEELLKDNKLGYFTNTKPPGHIMFYMLTAKLSNLLNPTIMVEGKYINLITFMSYVYPFISYLVIIPLFYLSKKIINNKFAIIPSILYLFAPNVTLINLYLDQVLYPLLFVICLYLFSCSFSKNNIVLAVISGIAIYLAIYVTFSLLPMIPLSILLLISHFVVYRSKENDLYKYLKILIAFFLGFIITGILFSLLLHYDIILRYKNSLIFHQLAKNWNPNEKLQYGLLNYTDFICWLGIPLAFLYLINFWKSLENIVKRKFSYLDLYSVSLFIIFILLGFFSKTKGEVGRLWIFMIPLVCISSSVAISSLFANKKTGLTLILVLQFITISMIKRFQDFR